MKISAKQVRKRPSFSHICNIDSRNLSAAFGRACLSISVAMMVSPPFLFPAISAGLGEDVVLSGSGYTVNQSGKSIVHDS